MWAKAGGQVISDQGKGAVGRHLTTRCDMTFLLCNHTEVNSTDWRASLVGSGFQTYQLCDCRQGAVKSRK